jgi:hypothetical protein
MPHKLERMMKFGEGHCVASFLPTLLTLAAIPPVEIFAFSPSRSRAYARFLRESDASLALYDHVDEKQRVRRD